MRVVLVTGGAGFIGSNFVRMVLLGFPDIYIVNLDCLTYAGNLENLSDFIDCANHKFIKGNICNKELVGKIVDRYAVDAIINFAAESHVDRSITDAKVFIETNISGTLALLEIARDKGLKFIQISTDEVYGSLGEVGVFTEQTSLSPNSPYAVSKASADLMVQSFGNTWGLKYNITRCSNNYGPHQFPEKLIPLMINNAINDKGLPVYGDGRQVRNWIHVDDHCGAILTVLNNGENGEIYNVGSDDGEKTNMEIVNLILKRLDKPHSLIRHVKDRPGHDRRYAISASKIMLRLGWKPLVDFERGINRTIDWYLTNKKWMEKITSGEYQKYYENMYKEGSRHELV